MYTQSSFEGITKWWVTTLSSAFPFMLLHALIELKGVGYKPQKVVESNRCPRPGLYDFEDIIGRQVDYIDQRGKKERWKTEGRIDQRADCICKYTTSVQYLVFIVVKVVEMPVCNAICHPSLAINALEGSLPIFSALSMEECLGCINDTVWFTE